jgi:PAS domain S-box-containing protein
MVTEGMDNTRYEVLLIEDDTVDQMAFMRLVENQGLPYNCTVAGSVAEAKSVLARGHFDVVIADYSLGDGTALDILDLVRDAPVIFATGGGSEEVATKAWRAGAYDYLIKDHDQNYLKIVPITVANAIKYKRTEEELKLLWHAVMSTSDSVHITDMDDRIIFVNRAFCETYGYREEEVIGQDCGILYTESQSGESRQNVRPDKGSGERQVYHKRKDGSEFPVSVSRSIVQDENRHEIALVAVARNISEHVFAENLVGTLLRLRHGNRRLG